MKQIFMITSILIVIKSLLLWAISNLVKFKKHNFFYALIICLISYYTVYILSHTIPPEFYRFFIISQLMWLLQMLLPLILIKIFYKISWLMATLPWIILILIDLIIRNPVTKLVYKLIPF